MNYVDAASRLLGWTFLACALFVGFRSGGPLRTLWVEWTTARQVGLLVRDQWDELSSTETSLGSQTGKVSAVEFIDYQCFYCRGLHDSLTVFLRDHATEGIAVRLLHRDSASQLAGAAAVCAAQEGSFGQMHAYLLTDTTWMVSLDLSQIAEAAGVQDLRAWDRCVRSEKTRETLIGDRNWAERLKIGGTPALVTPDGSVRLGAPSINEWMAQGRE